MKMLDSLGHPDATPSGQPNRNLVICGGLVAITLLVWIRVARNGFTNFDDGLYVVENAHIQAGLGWKTLTWALTSIDEANWHPLTWLSHALDYQLFGLNAAGHHLTNLLLHGANVVLLYLWLNGATRRAGRSFLVAALFAIHPLNVESVAWVAERKNVLCTVFVLMALLAYDRYVRDPNAPRYVLVALLFALALASKPMAVTLPCLLFLLDVWPLERILRPARKSDRRKRQKARIDSQAQLFSVPAVSLSRAIVEKLPLLALSLASSFATVYAQRYGGAVFPSATQLSVELRFENAIRAYGMYVWKAFFPFGLAPFYPHLGNGIVFWQVAPSAAFLGLVSFRVWRERKSAPYLLVGWLWFLGALVPVIGIVQVGKQAMADRYAYLPLIGIFVMAVWSAAGFADRISLALSWRAAIAAIVLAALSFLTRRQVGFWHSSVDLWTHTLAVTSNNRLAEHNLGNALVRAGRRDEAIRHFENTARTRPRVATRDANVAKELWKEGKPREAITSYEVALTASPDANQRAGVEVNLWTIYTQLGDFALAEENFEQALAIDSHLPENLIPILLESVSKYPSPQKYLQLGQLLQRAGNLEDARSAYQRALSLDPSFAQAKTMLARVNSPAK